MKKIAILFLLLSFSAKPLFQLGYLAYFELNQDYISAKYCINKDKPEMHCNGKCHLMKELSLGEPKKNGKKNISLVEIFYPLFYQEYDYRNQLNKPFAVASNSFLGSTTDLCFLYQQVPVPPPKV